MKRLIGLFLVVVVCSCSDPNSLKPQEFQHRIASTPDAVVIDVRTPKETYTTGIIEGALVSDYKSGEFATSIAEFDKSKTYFVYCASGMRSSEAANLLTKEGFEKVFILDGGTKAWEKEELPLVQR